MALSPFSVGPIVCQNCPLFSPSRMTKNCGWLPFSCPLLDTLQRIKRKTCFSSLVHIPITCKTFKYFLTHPRFPRSFGIKSHFYSYKMVSFIQSYPIVLSPFCSLRLAYAIIISRYSMICVVTCGDP